MSAAATVAGIITMPTSASATTVQSKICTPFATPSITAPADNTQTSATSVHVVGSAEPGMTVTISRNNTTVGNATVTSSGDYALDVPLLRGGNALVATSVDSCGTSKSSATILTTRSSQGFAPQVPNAITYTPPTTTPAATEPQTAPSVASNTPTQSSDSPPASQANNKTPAVSNTTPAPTVLITPAAWNQLMTNPPASMLAVPMPVTTNPNVSQQQVVTQPKQGSSVVSHRTWVGGSAQPQSPVVIYVNEAIVAQVSSDETGAYGALVELKQGANQINVLAQSGDGQATLREINVKLTSHVEPVNMPGNITLKESDTWIATAITLVFGLGGAIITGSLWWHAHLLQKQKAGVKHA